MRPEDLDPVRLGELISTLPPTHPLVAAARGAVDISDGRAEEAAAQREVQADVREAVRELPEHPNGFGRGVPAMQEQQAADSRYLAEQARERAETADLQERRYLEAEAQAHDERAERAEQRNAARDAGTPPREPDKPTDEQRALTAALVAEAREYLADQQLREDQRYLDGGVTRDDSVAEEADDGADDTAEMCASR